MSIIAGMAPFEEFYGWIIRLNQLKAFVVAQVKDEILKNNNYIQ